MLHVLSVWRTNWNVSGSWKANYNCMGKKCKYRNKSYTGEYVILFFLEFGVNNLLYHRESAMWCTLMMLQWFSRCLRCFCGFCFMLLRSIMKQNVHRIKWMCQALKGRLYKLTHVHGTAGHLLPHTHCALMTCRYAGEVPPLIVMQQWASWEFSAVAGPKKKNESWLLLFDTMLKKNYFSFSTDVTGESSDVHLAVRDVPRLPLWYLGLYDGQAAAHAGPHQHAHHKAPAGRHQPQPTEAGRHAAFLHLKPARSDGLQGEHQQPVRGRHLDGASASAQTLQLSSCASQRPTSSATATALPHGRLRQQPRRQRCQ